MDRRVVRTRHSLMQALIELILEKGFEATSISEIAERANVGRSTFYAHFADKDDLLQGSLDGLRAHLAEHIHAALAQPDPRVHPALAFSLPMLEHAGENTDLYAAMVGRRSGELFRDYAHDMFADLVRSNWDGADEIAVQSIAGAFGATMAWWLAKASHLEPSEVDRRFRALVEPALRERSSTSATRRPPARS